MNSSRPCALPATEVLVFPLLRQTAETSISDCTSPAQLPQPKSASGQMRIRVFLSSLINALYVDEFDCTLCRNLLAQTEKQLKLILISFIDFNLIIKSHTQHIQKKMHARKQELMSLISTQRNNTKP
jgi:hypothetical protein